MNTTDRLSNLPSTPKLADLDVETLELCRPYRKVLALGNYASKALDLLDIPHFKLPHPSPLNRQLNDPQYEENVLRECYNYLHED